MLKKNEPMWVLIDPKELIYTQYVGKRRNIKARSPRPLSVDEIETFRVNPKSMIDSPPEAA